MENMKKLWYYAALVIGLIALNVAVIIGRNAHAEHQLAKELTAGVQTIGTNRDFFYSDLLSNTDLIRYTDINGTEHLFYCTEIDLDGPYSTDCGEDSTFFKYGFGHHSWYPDGHIGKIGEVDMQSYDQAGEQLTYHYYYYNLFDRYQISSFQLIKVGDEVYERECTYQELPDDIDPNDEASLQAFLATNPAELTINHLPVVTTDATQDAIPLSYDDEHFYAPETPEPTPAPCGCENCCCDPDDCNCTSKASD